MRARNFSATTPFTNTPDRVASHTMPLRRTSERVLPCRSAVRIAIAFSSADRYIATLNASGACFPWREPPSAFLRLPISSILFCANIIPYGVCASQSKMAVLDRQSVMVLPVLARKTAVLLCESEIGVHLPRDIALYLFLSHYNILL